MRNKTTCLLFVLFMGCTLKAQAEPVVIYDTGKTTPLINTRSTQVQFAPPPEIKVNALEVLPVVTDAMTPGRVQARKINRPFLTQPIFIVGFDKLSLIWLKENRAQLKQHHATGIAVNVKTRKELLDLVQASGGLAINPVSGNKISRQLSLMHYPVLVSSTRIEQ